MRPEDEKIARAVALLHAFEGDFQKARHASAQADDLIDSRQWQIADARYLRECRRAAEQAVAEA